MPNSRMGMAAHVTGLQSGVMLWVMGLLWDRLALPDGAQRATQILAVVGLYPEAWTQGRTIFGGLQAALVLRAMRGLVPQAVPLRVLQTSLFHLHAHDR